MEKKTKKKKITFKILPNDERVIIRLIKTTSAMSGVVIPGQLKAGEALHTGQIVRAGNTKFKKDQIVYYSEYSAAKLTNMGSVLRKEQLLGTAMGDEDYHVVAADDVMAFEENVFDFERPEEVESPVVPGEGGVIER